MEGRGIAPFHSRSLIHDYDHDKSYYTRAQLHGSHTPSSDMNLKGCIKNRYDTRYGRRNNDEDGADNQETIRAEADVED